MLTPYIRILENRVTIFLCAVLGDSLSLVAIVAAVKDRDIAGLKPMHIFMLALASYIFFIGSLLARILAAIVEQKEA